jgi:hypothetical protein
MVVLVAQAPPTSSNVARSARCAHTPREIPVEVSDAAFQAMAGDLTEIVVGPCGGEGLALRELRAGERGGAD